MISLILFAGVVLFSSVIFLFFSMVGVVGHMSGGKTYFAVEQILKFLFEGHPVVTNIKLNCQATTDYLGIPCVQWKRLYFRLVDNPKYANELPLDDYEAFPTGSPRGSPDYNERLVYIVLDEVSSIFDSMTHATDSSIQKVATWVRHTRKRGQELILIMQFASELHKRLRVHINEYISCNNSSNLRIPLLGTGLPFFLKGISVRQRFLPDMETPIGSSQWFAFRPAVYKCYNTSQIVVGRQDPITPLVVPVDRSLYNFRVQLRLFLLCCVLYLLCVFAFTVYSFFGFS